jgi:hypothetical protein
MRQRLFTGNKNPEPMRGAELRRRITYWRATERPPREVFFAQGHRPGELCQSDFTHCRELGVTISGPPFSRLISTNAICRTWSLVKVRTASRSASNGAASVAHSGGERLSQRQPETTAAQGVAFNQVAR